MAGQQWLMFLAIALAAPGTLYLGARRDEVSSFWFGIVVASFIAMGVGYTEEWIVLFWIGALSLIVSTSLASVVVIKRRRVQN